MKPKVKDNKIYLTVDGLKNLQDELNGLVNDKRPKTVDRLALARSQGDLSENNEYAAAREELSFIDGRVEELEDVLKNVVVVEIPKSTTGVVSLGCKVTVKSETNQHVYHIVGDWEADPIQKKVSHSSPLGKALIGRKIGEQVEFEAPAGKVVFEIVDVG